MERFIARYEENGIKKSVFFDKTKFSKEEAEKYLNEKDIKNFFFFFEPYEPTQLNENTWMFEGEIGFDITAKRLLPYLKNNNNLIFDSFGGSLWDGLNIHDLIKSMDYTGNFKILGACMSAMTFPFLAVKSEQREFSNNSRFLIHNAWTMEAGDDAAFRKTADELSAENRNAALIYSNITGKSVEEMLDLMKEEKILNKQDLINWGFIKGEQINNNSNNNNNSNTKDMDKEKVQEKLNVFESALKGLKNIFSPVNLVVQDVAGIEIDFGEEIETIEQVEVGTTATVDGSPAEGEYIIGTTTYIFEAGAVTEIKPEEVEEVEENQEVEDLKTENAEQKTEIENLKVQVTNMTIERDSIQNKFSDAEGKFNNLSTQFSDFKNQFSEEDPKPIIPSGGGGKKSFSIGKKK